MILVSDLYCPSCRNAKDHKPQDNEVCWSCVAMGGAGNYKEFKTNYDRLTHMSMEELAATKKICRVTAENLDECEKWRFPDGSPDCYSCALDWLKQEVST